MSKSIKMAVEAMKGVFMEGTTTIEDLRARQLELNAKAQAIQAEADAEGRDVTEDEANAINEYCTMFDSIGEDIARREKMNEQSSLLNSSMGRVTEAVAPAAPESPVASAAVASQAATVTKPKVKAAKKGTVEVGKSNSYGSYGFGSMGEFALAVMKASLRGGGSRDPRLCNAASAVSSEATSADGGYAVPPDFKNEIMQAVFGEASLLPYTDQQTTSSNSITFPTDETTPWQATGGVRVNWTSEGGQITESKVALGEQTIKLEKLAALLPVTEELLEDAPAVSRYIKSRVPEVLGFALNNAVINGTGTGQPLGILPSSALVTVAPTTGQAADTVTFNNITQMWARMYARGKNKAVWIMNPIVSEQLMQMAFPTTGIAVPVYLPPSGLSGTPYATLMGRPVIESEACAPLGDKGDIILADLSQYMTVMKSIGLRADVSMHLYFDYDLVSFRFILRVGGRPWMSAPITAKDGTTQYSPFVTLNERTGV